MTIYFRQSVPLFFSFLIIFFIDLTVSAQHIMPISLHGNGMNFTENKGQVIDQQGRPLNDVLFIGDVGNGTKIYFQKNKISYVMTQIDGLKEDEEEEMRERLDPHYDPIKGKQEKLEHLSVKIHRVDVEFVGAGINSNVIASGQTKDYTNYYLPHCKDGVTVNSFTKLTYKNIYSNIDVVFKGGTKEGMEYDFVLNPGADPKDIKLKYTGADDIKLKDKTLFIKTSVGEIQEYIPESYQMIGGKKINIDVRYEINTRSEVRSQMPEADTHEETILNFKLRTYNPSYPLTIDPWATYYGGTNHEYGCSIKTDGAKNVLITGMTRSQDFPVTTGAFQIANGGVVIFNDAYVVKFDQFGNRLWATYYGGTLGDNPSYNCAVTTDMANNVIITGITGSSNFPISTGVFQTAKSGGDDAFVVKFNAAGSRLWATYYGGNIDEISNAVTTDNSQNIIITGFTTSPNFPVTALAFQSNLKNDEDIFVVKFDPSGLPLFSTYYGGSKKDRGIGVATDSQRNIIVTGSSNSSNFPVTIGAFQSSFQGDLLWGWGFAGYGDAILFKLDPQGNQLWSTYFGGEQYDFGGSVAIDYSDKIAITGSSNSVNFPTTAGAYDEDFTPSLPAYEETFVARFDGNGNRLWATFFNAHDDAEGTGLDVDPQNNIYITGAAENANMPVSSCALQTQFGGFEDYFLAKFDSMGMYICSTYLGRTGYNECAGFSTVSLSGNYANIVTTAFSGELPTSSGAFQTNLNGNYFGDVYIMQINANSCSVVSSIFYSDTSHFCNNGYVYANFHSTASSFYSGNINYQWYFPGGNPSSSTLANPDSILYNTAGEFDVKLVVSNLCDADSTIVPAAIGVYDATVLIPPNDTSVCIYDPIPLNATTSNGVNGTFYSWSPNYELNATYGPSVISSTTLSTLYYLTGACNEKDSVFITILPLPTISLSPIPTICIGVSTILTASGTPFYSWSPSSYLSATSGAIVVTSAPSFVTYSVSGIDNNGCVSPPKSVKVYPLPKVNFYGDPLVGCDPLLVLFSDSTFPMPLSCKWFFGDGGESTVCAPPTYMYDDPGIYSVKLIVTDNVGCVDSLTKNNYVTVYSNPTASFFYSPQLPTVITPLIQFIDTSLSDYSLSNWNWKFDFGGLNDSSFSQNPQYYFQDSGSYVVRLIVTDIYGCVDTVFGTIRILPDYVFYAPNTFTPNGDGNNDDFVIKTLIINPLSFSLIIYDRWGNRIFQSNDQFMGWDGKINGQAALQDVYIYSVDIIDYAGKSHSYTGKVALVR